MKIITSLLLSILVFLPAITCAEVRKFTDNTGREIQAVLIAVSGDQVEMNVSGKEFTLPLSKFSESDIKYIKEWGVANPAPVKIRGIYIDINKKSTKIRKPKPKTPAKTNNKNNNAPEPNKESSSIVDYTIEITNSANQPVENLTLKYTVYKSVKEKSETSSDDRLEEIKAHETIETLSKTEDYVVDVKSVTVTDFEGTDKKTKERTSSKETLWGIVVELYSGDTLVVSESLPDGLADRVKSTKEEEKE